jgi:molybdopterin synthase sulfur carrier subunit
MIVRIPSPLRSYTSGSAQVEAAGKTVADVLADLDHKYPGIRFRMIDEQARVREHIKIFINADQVEDLGESATASDTIHIICALSGG